MEAKMNIALYLRVSVEDLRGREESGSISSQRALLNSFVEEVFHGQRYKLMEFADDGHSGTSFERPAVRRLLKLAAEGRISCIAVKDFSRFSRDYIEMGAYLEQVFPLLGVRFLSINDHYDSQNASGSLPQLDRAFQSLINDLYAKDISVKVKSSLAVRKEKGIYANGSTPFGYRKAGEDRQKLVPVEPEAGIVRRIFKLTAKGASSTQIARQFNGEGIKTPVEYKIMRGMTSRKPRGKGFLWSDSVICEILRNDFYAGDLVYGKYETAAAGQKARLKPRTEWKVYKDHHEAIVDRETFALVQRSRGREKPAQRRPKHPLTGKLFCAGCGRALKIERTRKPYFFCPARYRTDAPECAAHLSAELLEQLILQMLRQELTCRMGADRVAELYWEAVKERRRRLLGEKKKVQEKEKRLMRKRLEVYEQYGKGKITREEYERINGGLEGKGEELKKRLQQQEERIKRAEEAGSAAWDTALDQTAADIFVKKMIISEAKGARLLWNFCRP